MHPNQRGPLRPIYVPRFHVEINNPEIKISDTGN